MPKDVAFSIRLDPAMLAELRALATADRRPLAQYLRLVLEEHIEDQRHITEAQNDLAQGRGVPLSELKDT